MPYQNTPFPPFPAPPPPAAPRPDPRRPPAHLAARRQEQQRLHRVRAHHQRPAAAPAAAAPRPAGRPRSQRHRCVDAGRVLACKVRVGGCEGMGEAHGGRAAVLMPGAPSPVARESKGRGLKGRQGRGRMMCGYICTCTPPTHLGARLRPRAPHLDIRTPRSTRARPPAPSAAPSVRSPAASRSRRARFARYSCSAWSYSWRFSYSLACMAHGGLSRSTCQVCNGVGGGAWGGGCRAYGGPLVCMGQPARGWSVLHWG